MTLLRLRKRSPTCAGRGMHMAKDKWSVRTFLICLLLACLLPGVIGATILIIYEYREGRAQLEKSTLQTTRAMLQAVDSQLLRAQAIAQALSTADSLARLDLASFHQRAREALMLAGLSTNVVLRDRAGRQILNTAADFGAPLTALPAPDQVRNVFATGRPDVSDLFIGPLFKRPIMSVNVPVIADRTVTYVLSVGILPEHFNTTLKVQKLPPDWIAGVFDSTGTIVGRTLSPDQYIGKKPTKKLMQAMMQSREGIIETTTPEGTPVLTAFTRSAITDWGVAIGIPKQSLEKTLVQTLSMLAAGVASLFGISLVLAWFMAERIARSVRSLTAPANALGAGAPVAVPRVQIKEAAEVALAIGRAGDLLKQRAAILRAKETELAEAHRLAQIGTWSWDVTSTDVHYSASMRGVFGRAIPPFPQQRGTLLPVESWEIVHLAFQEVLRSGVGYDLQLQANHGRGHTIWVNAKCEASRDKNGHVVALRGVVQDITERKLAEQRVRDAALHDVLTGLPNRAFVFEFCNHLLAASKRGHGEGALLFIDLDRFKPINDSYGHETGDRVLQEVARRLIACTRREDLVGRLGGDEFVIVLPYTDATCHPAKIVAQHVLDSLCRPFRINALELSVSSSIGISFFPENASDVSTLIHTADLAMYCAKQAGRANYQCYTAELDLRAEQTHSIELRLRNALKHGKLALHYQPVMDISSGKLSGAEALVRLTDEAGDVIGPASFIPVAEAAGLIGEIGDWVAMEACRQQAQWHSEGLKICISINVSPLQFRQCTFAEKLSHIIDAAGIDPACLEIEVTESAIMESMEDAVSILKQIKLLGIKVALDDFGTGYSSLSSLTSLPLDKLKVDQSFVRRIECDQPSRAVTQTIIALGQSLNLTVVGEGIESESALAYLRERGCHLAQGYWFSEPLPAAEFMQWHRHQHRQGQVRDAANA